MNPRRTFLMIGALYVTVISCGCQRSQDLPVVVSRAPDDGRLQWRDAHGPLRGEVPWVLRTDLLGPDTSLVVETTSGDACARVVSFRVLAAGVTEYTVTLVSDLNGRVSWTVNYGEDKHLKLFTCDPRPADDRRRECIRGGIPRPLFGELLGGFSGELEDGTFVGGVTAVRFERAFRCDVGATRTPGGEPPTETATSPTSGPQPASP